MNRFLSFFSFSLLVQINCRFVVVVNIVVALDIVVDIVVAVDIVVVVVDIVVGKKDESKVQENKCVY